MKPLFFKYTIHGKEYEVRAIVFPYVFSRCGKRHNLEDVEPATGWTIQKEGK
jgi:hypothetical protein